MPDRARFEDFTTFRSERTFVVRGAHDRKLRRRVLLVSGVDRDDPATRAALLALHRGHHRPIHFAIAPAIEWLETHEGPWVLFDAPATCDLSGLVGRDRAIGVHPCRSEADAFHVTLRDALTTRSAWLGAQGRDAPPLGRLAYGNLLFGPGGWFGWLGFGHNVILCDAHGAFDPDVDSFGPDTSASIGRSSDDDVVSLRRCLESIDCFVAPDAHEQDRGPELAAFRSRIARILGERADAAPTQAIELEVARDGSWFRRAGQPAVSLTTRRVLTRVLAVLVEARRTAPGTAVSTERLLRSAWPEVGDEPTARNRLYVSINALRSLGLGAELARVDDGYLLAPSTTVSFSETGEGY